MRHRTRAQKGKRPRVKSKKARIGHFGPRDVRATHDTPRDRHLSSNGQVSLSPRSNPTLRLKIQVSAKTHGRRQKYVPPIKRHAAHVVHGPSLTLHHLANGGILLCIDIIRTFSYSPFQIGLSLSIPPLPIYLRPFSTIFHRTSLSPTMRHSQNFQDNRVQKRLDYPTAFTVVA